MFWERVETQTPPVSGGVRRVPDGMLCFSAFQFNGEAGSVLRCNIENIVFRSGAMLRWDAGRCSFPSGFPDVVHVFPRHRFACELAARFGGQFGWESISRWLKNDRHRCGEWFTIRSRRGHGNVYWFTTFCDSFTTTHREEKAGHEKDQPHLHVKPPSRSERTMPIGTVPKNITTDGINFNRGYKSSRRWHQTCTSESRDR